MPLKLSYESKLWGVFSEFKLIYVLQSLQGLYMILCHIGPHYNCTQQYAHGLCVFIALFSYTTGREYRRE